MARSKKRNCEDIFKDVQYCSVQIAPQEIQSQNFMLYIVDSQILCTHTLFPHMLVFLTFGVITLDNHIII
jgi:hypothetical protein